MCFGSCSVTCDNCKPKFVECPACGYKNMLIFKACKQCKETLTDDVKHTAREEWKIKAQQRESET